MQDYTQEEIKRIASERCPNCDIPMSYDNDFKGFTCDCCKLLVPYATYKECQAKNRERIEAYLEEWKKKRADKH